jgi:hypothetical protein
MAVKQMITLKCDGPECPNVVEYPAEQGQTAYKNTPWMRTMRFVTTLDKREYALCSDVCMILLTKTGVFNPPVQPQQPTVGIANEADMAAAQAQADAKKASDENLKSGKGGKITLG